MRVIHARTPKSRRSAPAAKYITAPVARMRIIVEVFGWMRRRILGSARIVMKRSEEHTSELQSHVNLVCRLLLEKFKTNRVDRGERATSSETGGPRSPTRCS